MTKYFERTLEMLRLFGGKVAYGLTVPNAQNAKTWLDRIENELSPENLSCDGELRGSALRAKERELLEAQRYIRTTFPSVVSTQDHFLGHNYRFAFQAAISHAKRERTASRMAKLDEAIHNGFVPGARVLISNGTTGVIVKINRTRVKVKGDDNRMWSVPPRCMELLKVR